MISAVDRAEQALRLAIQKVIGRVPVEELMEASRTLSERYRDVRTGTEDRLLRTESEYRAYVAVRLPATFKALTSIFQEIRALAPEFWPSSQLDLGAGTGAAAWAAASIWPRISHVSLIDRDPRMLALGRLLEQANPQATPATWTWRNSDLTSAPHEPHDLVTVSYALGELTPEQACSAALAAWKATRGALVIVEPGTPRGFALIRELRGALIESKAELLAPCPHAGSCPIAGDDWCHFSARVQRSALHRQVKEADRSHEDEKFSYVAFMRTATRRASARVLRHPQRPPRRVQLVACTDSGLRRITLGKSHPAYKIAKDIKWGSALPPEALQ